VIDTFLVTDAVSGMLADREAQDRFERTLNEVVTGDLDLHELLRKRKRAETFSALMQGEQMPTVIRFVNDPDATRTVLDIETEDRVGLLHAISQVLADLNIDISIAKICTEKGAVMDSFYISEADAQRVLDRARQRQIELKVRKAIARLE
jgi:[protein-PII] uridylyltransferase